MIVDDQDRRSWLHGSSLAPRPAAGIGADPEHLSWLARTEVQGAARFGEPRELLASAMPGLSHPGPNGRTTHASHRKILPRDAALPVAGRHRPGRDRPGCDGMRRGRRLGRQRASRLGAHRSGTGGRHELVRPDQSDADQERLPRRQPGHHRPDAHRLPDRRTAGEPAQERGPDGVPADRPVDHRPLSHRQPDRLRGLRRHRCLRSRVVRAVCGHGVRAGRRPVEAGRGR